MPFGRSGGYRRQRGDGLSRSFAKKVSTLNRKKYHREVFLCRADQVQEEFEVPAGLVDHCFFAPATELCVLSDREEDEKLFGRGARLCFDVYATRSYSIRILAFRISPGPPSNLWSVVDTKASWLESYATTWGPLSTSALGRKYLVPSDEAADNSGSNALLTSVPGRDPVFYPISEFGKGRVFLDKTFHGRAATGFESRPFNVWVDLRRQLEYRSGSGVDHLLSPGRDEKTYDLMWVVLVHVPSFTIEKGRVLQSEINLSDMDLDDKGKGKQRVTRASTDSEASTIRLDTRTGAVLPALEIRNVRSSFFWTQ